MIGDVCFIYNVEQDCRHKEESNQTNILAILFIGTILFLACTEFSLHFLSCPLELENPKCASNKPTAFHGLV